MFGFIQAASDALDDLEKERYQEAYCGLCRALKERYGQLSRFCLTYDLTFYVILCNSLWEPLERRGEGPCLASGGKLKAHAISRFSDYAADLSVALAYHKMADDWSDERKLGAWASRAALEKAYERARGRIPGQCDRIEGSLAAIGRIERDPASLPDDAALEFGRLTGELFSWGQGVWEPQMRAFGERLGRFIYFMDAAVDLADDAAAGRYNPLASLKPSPDQLRILLRTLIGEAAGIFEKLPLEQDLHLLRSVLYSGVWMQFNEKYPSPERA